ncbi:MARVEL domain-containing protein 1 [Clupea harengus]|uniref:MARVEL domain-containing protein 1 n=1 Tax=Clupea harengus TaxID=7950 RepID=A0A6P3W446_CLUHA|nr:MARVEL domain-containing protein 1 [Clupea harengus]
MAPQADMPGGNDILGRVRSVGGVLRVLQLLVGAGVWVTIAANRYEGAIHFALLISVLFWLLTLASFAITVLDKQDLVPLIGGQRWSLSNLVHDVVATALYAPVIGIMAYKMQKNAYCNLEQYKHACFYKVYLTATVFAGLTTLAYLLSATYRVVQKCRGQTPPA